MKQKIKNTKSVKKIVKSDILDNNKIYTNDLDANKSKIKSNIASKKNNSSKSISKRKLKSNTLPKATSNLDNLKLNPKDKLSIKEKSGLKSISKKNIKPSNSLNLKKVTKKIQIDDRVVNAVNKKTLKVDKNEKLTSIKNKVSKIKKDNTIIGNIMNFFQDVKLNAISSYTINNDKYAFKNVIIVTALSARHIRSLSEDLSSYIKENKNLFFSDDKKTKNTNNIKDISKNNSIILKEGSSEDGWIALEIKTSSTIIHFFTQEAKEKYKLEDHINGIIKNNTKS